MFPKILALLCVGSLKEKKNDLWELKNKNKTKQNKTKKKKKEYEHDTAIKNGQVCHWSLKIKICMIYF